MLEVKELLIRGGGLPPEDTTTRKNTPIRIKMSDAKAIWPPSHSRRRKKSRPWGKQKVTAQIMAIDGDFVKLTILKSEITENIIGSELKPHKAGTVITKKRQTLLRGEPERLLWSEEDVRKALLAYSQ